MSQVAEQAFGLIISLKVFVLHLHLPACKVVKPGHGPVYCAVSSRFIVPDGAMQALFAVFLIVPAGQVQYFPKLAVMIVKPPPVHVPETLGIVL